MRWAERDYSLGGARFHGANEAKLLLAQVPKRVVRIYDHWPERQSPRWQLSDQAIEQEQHDELAEALVATGRGNREAFARAYRLAAPRLFPIAVRLLHRREVAEEILQEAFLAIWRKAAQFDRQRGAALGWMIAVVRNCAIDRLRADAREDSGSVSWDELSEQQLNQFSVQGNTSAHLGASTQACLDQLDEIQRKLILLAYYHGLSHSELATRLAMPLGTAKSTVRRALIRLRGCLAS